MYAEQEFDIQINFEAASQRGTGLECQILTSWLYLFFSSTDSWLACKETHRHTGIIWFSYLREIKCILKTKFKNSPQKQIFVCYRLYGKVNYDCA